jgi:hypothetical protein
LTRYGPDRHEGDLFQGIYYADNQEGKMIVEIMMNKPIMTKQFLISALVMFVATMAVGFVVHGVLLGQDYAALPNLYRGEEDSQNYFHFMLLAHVLMAIGLTWVYRIGRDDSPWLGQGIRFGIAVVVLMTIPTYMIYFAVQPMPEALAVKQIMFDTGAMILMGMLVALLNR